MAIWKQQEQDPVRESVKPTTDSQLPKAPPPREEPERTKARKTAESVIAADLAIEGKIEGSGHVRLVGTFKGDVHVKGNFTIDPG